MITLTIKVCRWLGLLKGTKHKLLRSVSAECVHSSFTTINWLCCTPVGIRGFYSHKCCKPTVAPTLPDEVSYVGEELYSNKDGTEVPTATATAFGIVFQIKTETSKYLEDSSGFKHTWKKPSLCAERALQ